MYFTQHRAVQMPGVASSRTSRCSAPRRAGSTSVSLSCSRYALDAFVKFTVTSHATNCQLWLFNEPSSSRAHRSEISDTAAGFMLLPTTQPAPGLPPWLASCFFLHSSSSSLWWPMSEEITSVSVHNRSQPIIASILVWRVYECP